MLIAVWPVTYTLAPSPSAIVSRMLCTRSTVFWSSAPEPGITVISAAVCFWSGTAGVATATSGSVAICFCTVVAYATAFGPSTRISSGPLTPGPNRSSMIASALAWVLPSGERCARVVCILKNGSAITASASTASTRLTTRFWVTVFAQPLMKPRPSGRVPWSSGGRLRSLRGSARRPMKPRIAGTRVIATSTATTMVADAARPISVRNGMPTTDRPASAMKTVRPAVTTAEPAVPTAYAAAVSTSLPERNSCRKRVTMNSA